MSEISEIRKQVGDSLKKLDELIEAFKTERDKMDETIASKLEILQLKQFNPQQLDDFFDEPYVMLPARRPERWYVVVPKLVNFQVGYLDRSTKSYNIFVVSKYVRWFVDIPKVIQDKLRFKEPLPYKVSDGMLLTGEHLQNQAWEQYKRFLSRREGRDKIRIKKGLEFRLVSQIIEDGTIPFLSKPVADKDVRDFKAIQLRSYQNQAWKTFLETGAIGVFWPFGAGKSFMGLYVLGKIKGRKLVVVSTTTLREQWKERIRLYLDSYMQEIDVQTYHSYHKVRDEEYELIIFDEAQHLPANTFIRLATLRAKYRMGFSGSPYREDGRENYIIALTGFPVGMAWEELINLKVVKQPVFRVYIFKDDRQKLRKLGELLEIPVKTLVFCDWIKLGEKISKTFNIPFIHGATKDKLDLIRDSQICVVSRVGDEGISLPDIERVIEVGFLFGSRMQESQRFGRLMHALKEEPEHIILFTEDEYSAYQKRLYAIHERGFHVEYIR